MIRSDLDLIPSYVPGKHTSGALKLSSNEAAYPPLPAAVEAMSTACATANRYPDMAAVGLKTALRRHLKLDNDYSLAVTVGTGSSALCQQLVQITTKPGEEVLFAWRSFEAYPIFAHVVGAKPVAIPVTEDGQHDLTAMARAITGKTRLIFLCSPNNPTGQVITREAFSTFMNEVPRHVLVALDEAYFEFNRSPDAIDGADAVRLYPNVVSLRTFSKAYGLAGLRVGYAFGNSRIIEALDKVAIPFGVSSVAQAGAIASLAASNELLERTEETVAIRDEVAEKLGALRSQGNFVWLPGVDAANLAERLAAHNVIVRAFPEGLRVTVTTEEEARTLFDAWQKAGL